MIEGYEEIKQGLIGLLCVGDKINRVYISTDFHNDTDHRFAIVACTVLGIHKDCLHVSRSFSGSVNRKDPYSAIDMHEGQLYIWNTSSRYYGRPPMERLNKLISILNSKDTLFHEF